jgi:hypothetical protein
MFKRKYSDAFKTLLGRNLRQGDGFNPTELAQCEKRLKLKLPRAFREYYEFAEKCQSIPNIIFCTTQRS